MHTFAWVDLAMLQDVVATPFDTVADAMVTGADAPSANGDVLKAGGIDLLGLMKEDLIAPRRVIDLRGIAGLDRIEAEDGAGVRIGALATIAAVAGHPLVASHYPILADAAGGSGSPQSATSRLSAGICCNARGAGTSAPSTIIASRRAALTASRFRDKTNTTPSSTTAVRDRPPVHGRDGPGGAARDDRPHKRKGAARLSAWRTSSCCRRGHNRENDLEPHEILTAIELPRLPASARAVHLKQGEKDSFDWPLADVAVVLDFDAERRCKSAAVVLGAAAPVPHRAKAAESALIGRRIDASVAGEAGRAALNGATPLAMNTYKLPLFETLVRRAVLKAVAGQ